MYLQNNFKKPISFFAKIDSRKTRSRRQAVFYILFLDFCSLTELIQRAPPRLLTEAIEHFKLLWLFLINIDSISTKIQTLYPFLRQGGANANIPRRYMQKKAYLLQECATRREKRFGAKPFQIENLFGDQPFGQSFNAKDFFEDQPFKSDCFAYFELFLLILCKSFAEIDAFALSQLQDIF